jgi:hypothetical protein
MTTWSQRAKERYEEKRQQDRLDARNKPKRPYHDSVSVIHWVKDTPHSLAVQFGRWKHAKQR